MSNLLKFYSDSDLQLIHDNIDQIEMAATKQGYKILDPNNDEHGKVNNIIFEYIKEKKRIVYGGTAYHAIIEHYRKDKNSKNKIYPDWERYDVEFYTPNPIADLVAICNRLYNAKIKYVMGRQAQHNETFTIFANFLQYCDMSYMPQNVFDNINHLDINGIQYIHPDLILIDIFRMYNDPLTSYWRLSKVFKRMQLLLDKFPFEFTNAKLIQLKSIDEHHPIIDFVLPKIVNEFDKILFIGELTYLIYTDPDNNINTSNKLSQIELITDDLELVSEYIKTLTYKWVDSKKNLNDYDKIFTIKKYSRFFQYWDKRTVFFYKGKPIITVIGSANRCIPILKSQITFGNKDVLKINIGTFLVTFNYFFVGYYYEKINKLGFYFGSRDFINSLLSIRNHYLESRHKTIMDDTIYKEFIIDCIGYTIDFSREFMLELNEKRNKGIRGIFSYDPNTSIGMPINSLEFEQSDGLELV